MLEMSEGVKEEESEDDVQADSEETPLRGAAEAT